MNATRRWRSKIEELLKTDKTYFIVVGAGHLVGKRGLLQLLGKDHQVEQMTRRAIAFRN
jgi:uncharacterized protein YbaP (TraB family)